jgi:lipopolysaccharide biosynthesis glycosyltransferase
LVADFLKSDADTLLFVDADVVVTADAILRLMALSLDKDITAGIYPRRGMDRKFFLDYYLDEQGALEFDKKVSHYKSEADNIGVMPFSTNKWSN